MNISLSRFLLALSCLLLAACASYSGIAPQAKSLEVGSLKGSGAATAYAGWPKQDWWRELADPVLSGLIEQALVDSPNMQAATAKLNRARAVTGLAESSLWPQVGASLSVTRERFSERGIFPPPLGGSTHNLNDLQIGGQWELDFFGKNRAELKAALGELRATDVERQAARMLLASDVARSYYNLARLLGQHEVAEQRNKQRIEIAALVERRFKSGLDTRMSLEAAQGVVPENARDMASLDEQIGLARHALAALIGQGPEAANAVAPTLPAVADLALPPSLPADLLGHRADIVAARWRVEAAVHGLESSKALFYPNINLHAFTGYSAIGFDNWLDAGSRQPGMGLAIHLPFFDAGRLRSHYRANAAQVDGLVATYNITLLDALRDVADQLSTLHALATQLARQQAALSSAERSHGLALRRYQAGITDRLSVLNAETNLLALRRTSVDLQARWIDGRVRLIRALGGGFEGMSTSDLAAPLNSSGQPS